MIDKIQIESEHFAKRQMTWWAKDKDIRWFHPEKKHEIIDYISNYIRVDK